MKKPIIDLIIIFIAIVFATVLVSRCGSIKTVDLGPNIKVETGGIDIGEIHTTEDTLVVIIKIDTLR